MEGNFCLRSFQVGNRVYFYWRRKMNLSCYPMGLSVTESQIEAGESDSLKVEFSRPEKISSTQTSHKWWRQIWLEQCQQFMELKPYWGHWGNTGSWLKAAVVLRQLTHTVNLRKHQQEVAAATCRLFMLTSSLVWQFPSLENNYKKNRLTPSDRGQSSNEDESFPLGIFPSTFRLLKRMKWNSIDLSSDD